MQDHKSLDHLGFTLFCFMAFLTQEGGYKASLAKSISFWVWDFDNGSFLKDDSPFSPRLLVLKVGSRLHVDHEEGLLKRKEWMVMSCCEGLTVITPPSPCAAIVGPGFFSCLSTPRCPGLGIEQALVIMI